LLGTYAVQDERFFRPADVLHLIGDATKAHSKLGWKPQIDFQQLIAMMVDADLENEKRSLEQTEPKKSIHTP
jgi:GDPmannose 4,6-dehydratase